MAGIIMMLGVGCRIGQGKFIVPSRFFCEQNPLALFILRLLHEP